MAHPNNETLSLSALMIFNLPIQITLILVTHSNINTLDISILYRYNTSSTYQTFCYQSLNSIASGKSLQTLYIYGLFYLFFILMSCYAFFKRWLPLSQLVKIFEIKIFPFTLNFYFKPLANDLGCFPLDSGPSRSKSVYLLSNKFYSEFY